MEETKLKIAALQMGSFIGSPIENRRKISEILEKEFYKGISPDVIILPEVWTVGWDCSKFIETAESLNCETVSFLKQLAKKYNSYILGGSFIEQDGEAYYNTCPVISPEGNLLAKYRKNHLFSYYGCDEGSFVKPGENPVMIEINGFKIGLSICYDIRFPEIYRAYRRAGADLLVNMAAWPLGRKNHWLALTRARAVENQCYFVALTQSGVLSDGSMNLGHSLIYDYNGEILDELSEGEGVVYSEIEKSMMYSFRDKCTVLKDIHANYEVVKC